MGGIIGIEMIQMHVNKLNEYICTKFEKIYLCGSNLAPDSYSVICQNMSKNRCSGSANLITLPRMCQTQCFNVNLKVINKYSRRYINFILISMAFECGQSHPIFAKYTG